MTVQGLTAEALSRQPLPPPPENADKHARGTVLVAAGGAAVPGVPILTGRAALRVGAGRLRLAATREAAIALGMAVPEAGILRVPATATGEFAGAAAGILATAARACSAVVLGPGMTSTRATAKMALAVLSANLDLGLIADAAALPTQEDASAFAVLAGGRVVLTPHAGEMARMLDLEKSAVLADPLACARRAAAKFKSVVVMKGGTTFIVMPSGGAWRHEGGVPGLATSGSGDVLAGVIGGLLARGASPEAASIWGVYLHAEAGRRLAETVGPVGFIASDLLDLLPRGLLR